MTKAQGLFNGLTEYEARRRLAQNGPNLLKSDKKHSAAKIFAGQFRDLMVLILLAATAISAFLGETHEALAIVAIVLANALLGFFQELRCERTLEALAAMSAPTAKVRRDGRDMEIPAAQVVEGDLLLIFAGDCIAADAVLLSQSALSCDESLLTGESLPAQKQISDSSRESDAPSKMVFMGTHAVSGRGEATVCAVGMNTEMGKIAGMLGDIAEEETPLQKRLNQVGKAIGAGCLIICAVVAAAGIMRGFEPLDMLITGISLAVAAVPEGLPAIVTVSLALAVRRILHKNALVKRLHAVETLGCATVICSDKTGTLTQNKMRVQRAATLASEYDFESLYSNMLHEKAMGMLIRAAAFCNDAKPAPPKKSFIALNQSKAANFIGDPTETALLSFAFENGVYQSDFLRSGELPFDSARKRMTVWGGCNDGIKRVFMKGAPEVVLSRCTRIFSGESSIELTEPLRREMLKKGSQMAGRALRVLGFAFKEGDSPARESDLVFLGLAGLFDPPREEAAAAVASCKSAKIRPVMITGDHADTALAVARQLGIAKESSAAITGAMLDNMTEQQLCEACKTAEVFARVSPSHKLAIVRCMKKNGEIVAMTGDGINDAPAVKEANIGVAMGENGTDVTREAADVVLLDDNFATLVSAVEEGRVIYQNIRRFLRYLLSCNAGEVFTMFVGMLMGMPVILTPIQLLLINLITDGLPAIALGLEGADATVMRRAPRAPDESIFAHGLLGKILFRGCLIGITTLGVFSLFASQGASLQQARTAALLTLTMTQLFHAFECRSEAKGLLQINPFGNPMLAAAAAASFFFTAMAVYSPFARGIFMTTALTAEQLLTVIGMSLFVPILSSLTLLFRKSDNIAFVSEKPKLKINRSFFKKSS